MRRKPYTEAGISRVPCERCGKPSSYQWQVCATGNLWCGICTDCDIELNWMVLRFMRVKNTAELIREYKARRQ